MGKDSTFINNYKILNNSYTDKFIYPLTNRGYASEANNLILAILYGLVSKKQLVLYDRTWNAGRWDDFFESIFPVFTPILTMPNFIFSNLGLRRKAYRAIHGLFYRNYELTDSNLWSEIRNKKWVPKTIDIPSLKLQGDMFNVLRKIESELFVKNAFTKQIIQSYLEENNYEEYLGLHVRRGDKLIREASSFKIEEYLNLACHHNNELSNIFIASDSFKTIKEFNEIDSKLKLKTFCKDKDVGHDQRTFNNLEHNTRVTSTRELLLEVEILSKCDVFIGTFSSNIGRLVHLKRNGKRSYSLDSSWSI